MFVASCTVLPNRITNENFRKSVDTFCNHPSIDRVIIHYPKTCKRLQQPYPEPPSWMQTSFKVQVNMCEDLGPVTKVAPLLDLFDASNTDVGVILFDDDRLYHYQWIDELIIAFQAHNRLAAVGRHGSLHKFLPFQYDTFNMTHEDEPFLSIKTTFGSIYPLSALPSSSVEAVDFVTKYENYGSMTNDDMMLAAWCYRTQTPIYVITTSTEMMQQWNACNKGVNDDVSLSEIQYHVPKQLRLASAMIAQGDFPCPWPDISCIIGVTILFIMLLILLLSMLRV